MGKQVTYGTGGYDPTKPNNNVVEEIDSPDDEALAVASDNVQA